MYLGYLCLLDVLLYYVHHVLFVSGSPATKKTILTQSGALLQFVRSRMPRSSRMGRFVQTEEFFFLTAGSEASLRKIVIKHSNFTFHKSWLGFFCSSRHNNACLECNFLSHVSLKIYSRCTLDQYPFIEVGILKSLTSEEKLNCFFDAEWHWDVSSAIFLNIP